MEMVSQSICILDNVLLNDIDFRLFDMDQIESLISCVHSTRGVSVDEFKNLANFQFPANYIQELMTILRMDLDIRHIVDQEYTLIQMREIKMGMYYANGVFSRFKAILNPKFTNKQMHYINKASWSSIDPNLIAHVKLEHVVMEGLLGMINDMRIKYSIKTVDEIFEKRFTMPFLCNNDDDN